MNAFATAANTNQDQDFLPTTIKLEVSGKLLHQQVYNSNCQGEEITYPEFLGANGWLQSELNGWFYPVIIKVTGRKDIKRDGRLCRKCKLTYLDYNFETGIYDTIDQTVDAWMTLA